MGILFGLIGLVLFVILVGYMATGLGTILGVLSLIVAPPGRKPKPDPNRCRTIEEIEWDKTHRTPMRRV